MDRSKNEDRVPSSTRIWQAERAKKCTNSLVPPGAAWRPCSGEIVIAYIEGIVVYSSAARDYIPAAVPSGADQEARYPAGTLGDIQAVTASLSAAAATETRLPEAGPRDRRAGGSATVTVTGP